MPTKALSMGRHAKPVLLNGISIMHLEVTFPQNYVCHKVLNPEIVTSDSFIFFHLIISIQQSTLNDGKNLTDDVNFSI